MKWTDEKLRTATLVHGPDRMKSDTYRLSIPGEDGKPGHWLDVPGWMVGDEEGAELRVRAAGVIRERQMDEIQERVRARKLQVVK